MARRPLPSAPPEHDARNQNEERRAIMQMLQELRRRLDKVEEDLSG